MIIKGTVQKVILHGAGSPSISPGSCPLLDLFLLRLIPACVLRGGGGGRRGEGRGGGGGGGEEMNKI